MLSLQTITVDSIVTNVLDKNMSIGHLEKNLCRNTFDIVMDKLYKYDMNNWKYNMYKSLVEIESKRWVDVNITWNKYYDTYGMRDWYEDIEIELDEEYDENWEDYELEYPNNIKMIKQFEHEFYHIYRDKARELAYDEDDYDSENSENFVEDYDY